MEVCDWVKTLDLAANIECAQVEKIYNNGLVVVDIDGVKCFVWAENLIVIEGQDGYV